MSVAAFQDAQNKAIVSLGYTNWFGWPKAPNDLTAEELNKVRDATAQYIVANPSDFDEAQVAAAQRVVSSGIIGDPLADTSFIATAGEFASDVGQEALDAGSKVAGVGQGVLSTLSLSKYLIPVAAIIIAGILLYAFYKKRTA